MRVEVRRQTERSRAHAAVAGAAARALVAFVAVACAADRAVAPGAPTGDPAAFRWTLPAGFPVPIVPADNPMSDAKVALGRRLFYDTRLSGNQAFSCASCHRQENAFADARNLPFGSTGQPHPRNSMALANVAYQVMLGWANPDTRSLEAQALIPMFGEMPVELALHGREDELLRRLGALSLYRDLFTAAFPGDSPHISVVNVTRALAAFERAFVSGNAPYDRYKRGSATAISDAAKRGEALFFGDRLKCAQCHSGPLFTSAARWVGGTPSDPEFVNTALYNIDGAGRYPAPNTGLFAFTGRPADMGRFKVPSLRNVEVTYPYMHDGTISTLEAILDHYAAGGRTVRSGPNQGDGSRNPFKSPLVAGFTLSPGEKADVVAFLRSLTDSTFLTDPRLSNPWIVK